MIVITTERLVLREFEATDSEFIIKLLNTDGWLRYIGDRYVRDLIYRRKIKAELYRAWFWLLRC